MEQNNNIYLSVIIPAYNEAERIEATLRRTGEYLRAKDFLSEVIVVVDGAKDATAAVAQKLSGEISNLRVIDRKENRGKGYTVREGMLAAQGSVRVFTDADNSTDIAHFDLMKPLFDCGEQVVIASREPKDAPGAKQSVAQKWYKRLLGDMGNLFIQIVAVRGIWDTQCGFKAFSAAASDKIFSRSRIDRWGFDIEALALAHKFGYKIAKIPADWKNDPRSHVRMSAYFQVLWETVKIRWWLMTGQYNGS
ncbi:MAG: glycosyltransferase family 2 protein [Candidatus Niyogibacteria bacterium]|nr:glycosyltransferase family 2 protein [Candidatus Niyogibacteria bacterium]